MNKTLRAGIAGATGYTGIELVQLDPAPSVA